MAHWDAKAPPRMTSIQVTANTTVKAVWSSKAKFHEF